MKISQEETIAETRLSGSIGTIGAYVSFTVPHDTPNKIYYQCQNHAYMGSKYGFNIVYDDEVNNIAFHKNVSIENNECSTFINCK